VTAGGNGVVLPVGRRALELASLPDD